MEGTPFSDKKIQIALFATIIIVIFFLVSTLGYSICFRPVAKFPNIPIGHWQRPTTAQDINGWMTFEYINFVFKLPPEYLKGTLALENVGYPWVTVWHVARVKKVNLTEFIRRTQEAVTEYQP
jgi:hypothetical protein